MHRFFNSNTFSVIQAITCFLASLVYAYHLQGGKFLYWFLAGCITLVVTYGMK